MFFIHLLVGLTFRVHSTPCLTKCRVIFVLVSHNFCFPLLDRAFCCIRGVISSTIHAARGGLTCAFMTLPTLIANLELCSACNCNVTKFMAFVALQGSCSIRNYCSPHKAHFDMLGCHFTCKCNSHNRRCFA